MSARMLSRGTAVANVHRILLPGSRL